MLGSADHGVGPLVQGDRGRGGGEALEREYPAWLVRYYQVTDRKGAPVGAVVATLREPSRLYTPHLAADSPEELAEMLPEAERERAEKLNPCPTCGHKRG